MRFILIVLFYFTLTSTLVFAQEDHHHDHDNDHHEHHENEISVANSAVYFLEEKEYAYGLHAHYVRNIRNSAFGLGVSYERVFDEHKHNTIGIVASYRPVNRFALSLSPGVAFEDTGSHASLALHVEATYEFPLGDFHVGPLVEFAMDKEDQHLSFGIHLGYGF